MLLPEIALTAQFLDRSRRASARGRPNGTRASPSASASGSGPRSASGEARVVVGARSALFLPFADLGLIVVDEEHEGAYKQEDGVIYNARDMAVVRARLEKAPIVLASATPSLETRVNAESGRYRWLRLPSRFGEATLPDIAAVDLRREGPPRGRWLSPRAIAGVEEARGRGEQALLFLNRRGYAPLTLCRACGHRFQCPNCAAWLVEHRFREALVCHHCGHVEPRPKLCPNCHEADTLTACGPGVERLAEEAAVLFPDVRTLVLSSDFPGGDREPARPARRGGARRLRPHHRHATCRQGPQFPAADVRRRGRRRCRPRQRRSARGRAHVPASAPGDRARRTRREARAARCCRPGSRTIR